jgi:asparagine synthase (glutamine-hydrolysing)
MCGIVGFVESTPRDRREAAEVLARMNGTIVHRGPDDAGAFVDGSAALAMRRLSIVDLEGGRQPISTADGRFTIVYNGEVYNFRELRQELEGRGHRFRTRSDTEVILRAYEQFGASCVDHLRGMFAFAVWDARERTLFLARDRVGIKPLYVAALPGGGLAFGSELKALVEHPEVGRDVDPRAVDAYLAFGYVPDSMAIFSGVSKLPPGHRMTWRDGHASVSRYWDFAYEPAEERPVDEYLEELRALVDEAVRIRMIAEVPLGAFLSGGIDSSTVVGTMARHSTRPVKTFSIGFREDSYDELKFARVAAARFGTEHHEFVVTPEICRIVDELVWHFDEPFADSSAIPTYMVSKLARNHVTVALSGDGGDELFAGYTRYAIDRDRSGYARIPRAFRQGVMRPVAARLPHGAPGRNFVYNVSLDPVDRYLDSVATFSSLQRRSLYAGAFRERLDGPRAVDQARALASRVASGDALDRLLYVDSKTYLPGDILTKVDRMSMAVSLEARVPLLDHKLVEFVGRIPSSLKLRGGETKHVLKRAVRGLVPDEILDRPKQGFGVPIAEWLNAELRDEIRDALTDPTARGRGIVDPAHVDVLLDEHARGRRDHSTQLWTLFMLERWFRAEASAARDREAREPMTRERIACG